MSGSPIGNFRVTASGIVSDTLVVPRRTRPVARISIAARVGIVMRRAGRRTQ